jgi:hypothetical protein
MKVPPKDDPHGDKEGAIPGEQVLEVLREHGLAVKLLPDNSYEISSDDEIAVYVIPSLAGGVFVKHLARRFSIPLVDFYYHPVHGRRFKPKH